MDTISLILHQFRMTYKEWTIFLKSGYDEYTF